MSTKTKAEPCRAHPLYSNHCPIVRFYNANPSAGSKTKHCFARGTRPLELCWIENHKWTYIPTAESQCSPYKRPPPPPIQSLLPLFPSSLPMLRKFLNLGRPKSSIFCIHTSGDVMILLEKDVVFSMRSTLTTPSSAPGPLVLVELFSPSDLLYL